VCAPARGSQTLTSSVALQVICQDEGGGGLSYLTLIPLGCMAREPLGYSCLHLPSTAITMLSPAFYLSEGDETWTLRLPS